ncbi:MAG: choice-of-anchor P family protein [Acidimicrobiales bacterium]
MAVVMIVSGLGGLFLTQGTASADVDSVRGTGYGISVRLAGTFVIPPTPDPAVNPPLLVANESSSDFGPHTASVVTIGGVLGILNNGIAVGPVATQAANIVGENHLGSIASNSQVANISALTDAINIPLISTTCVANGDGFTTSLNVSNARLGLGAALLNGPVAANTTIDILGVATIRLHERQVVENVAPTGGNPGRTRVVVNGARISVPMDGSILEIILAQAECEAVGPDVLLPSTTAPSTTSSTVAATTSSTAGATTSSTVAATTSSTVAATTSSTVSATTSTTSPPTGTVASTTTTTVAGVVTSVSGGGLVRTGSDLQPLAVLSVVSIVLGILLMIGSGRPLTANAGSGGVAGVGYAPIPGAGPEKWGPVEIAKTIWAGFAMVIIGPGELVSRRRRRRRGDHDGDSS